MFLKYAIFFNSILFLAESRGFAQSNNGTDSLRHTTAPPITVISDGYNDEIAIHPTDIRTVTADQLQMQTGATRLSDALQVLHPSLDIRNYGSLGGVSFASFRGLPAEYSSVYWEGIKITNSQNSLTDLALIDLHSIQSIGIISSANAQLIAGDIGSAGILLTTNPRAKLSGIDIGTSLSSANDLSSLGEKQLDLGAAAKVTEHLSITGGMSTAYSDGAFPFLQQSTGNIVNRENNDAHLFNANAAADYAIDESASLKAFSYFSRAERGAPGAVTIDNRGASNFNARQYDEDFLFAVSIRHIPLPSFEYTISLGYQSQYETYDLPALSVADRYLNRIYSFIWKSKTILADWSDLYAGLDYTKNLLFSNENSSSRGHTGISRESYAAYLAFKAKFLNNFEVSASLRTELLSDINRSQTLPGISLHYLEPNTSLVIQASYGKLYHAPTFNELYWRTGGNLNLHPESGISAEISAGIPIAFSSHLSADFQATVYRTEMHDQIIWQPTANNNIWSPSNVKSSRSQGVEITGDLLYSFSEYYKLKVREEFSKGKAANLDSDSSFYGKELPYSTPERSVLLIEFGHSSIGNLALTVLYRWHRYTDFYNNESTKLPPMTKIDITFSSIPIDIAHAAKATFMLSVLNLRNLQYQEIPSYPLPGRTIRFSLDIHFL